ncbi:hypothetical protein [Methylobacterium persicinum]|uniref:Uncharacterized protein n=1 Tax=Methylobacterium persicinum TaxID=374426 RepID=A0ABU0HR10_9HYPH|nr:hypothetical protein [Methylobacterium persicinum]MDQ0444268.1 hypothetical protein [Methylobacterium persicinum]GJE36300.1 hypothetical protein KHHGKMAE_0348 [Methylobacterium persicinum]
MLARSAILVATSLLADPTTAAPEPAATAFTLQRMVPRGEARTIAFYTSLFPDCSPQGPVVVRLLTQPRHGRVSLEDAQSFPLYAASSPLAECNAHKVPGRRMIYEGEAGYEGTDAFRVLVINADGTGYESDVQISVR